VTVLHETLSRAWSVQKLAVPIIPTLYFSPEGLALGAGTILSPAIGPRCLANLQGDEARLLTLLSATFGKAISPSVLGSISQAAKSWGKGDDVAAAIYLTHAGLPRPDDPTEAARRLFVTDAFIKSGTSPIGILQALGLEASYVGTIAKLYNELEPRVPAGDGIISGRWTKFLSFLGDLTGTQATQLALWATRLLGPAAIATGAVEIFRTIFVPTDNPIRDEGDIKGLPGGHYSWNRDERLLHFTYERPDGSTRIYTAELQEDVFRDAAGRIVGRLLPNGVAAIDKFAVFPGATNDNEPRLCPVPGPDKAGSDSGKDYEDFVKRVVNPENPTPRYWGFQLPNVGPTGGLVHYDDCEHSTGTMVETKDGYTGLLQFPQGMQSVFYEFLDQSKRQVDAAGDRPVRWYFSEAGTAAFAAEIFYYSNEGRERIQIVVLPKIRKRQQ
jgi:hypothetical protein